jgi:glucose/arabinose dehydrogenase
MKGAFWTVLLALPAAAATPFHGAPASAKRLKNPYKGDAAAVRSGATLYAARCASCHGPDGGGTGNIPSLSHGPAQTASDGELFWFIDKGAIDSGMPPSGLPAKERWQVVAFLKALPTSPAKAPEPEASLGPDDSEAPPPRAPFTDYRYEKPGVVHKIVPSDLPPPHANVSASNGPHIVERPAGAWPQVPPGFRVGLYASELENPRLLRTAPNGDIFLAESSAGKIHVFHGMTADGKPEQSQKFASGLSRPYGIAFYPPGKDPRWLYVGNTDSVVRFAYHSGDLRASGAPEKIAELPHSFWGGHWTRDLQFSLDGKTLFVAVGSASNIDDPDTTPGEKNRADILAMNPDGSNVRVYAAGIRNAGGGLAVNPTTGELWCSTNERDALGDDLVPDYITRVREGGFYGWPWWYIGAHQDPRHEGKHPELREKTIVPDVLLQPHLASLELAFYSGGMFPAEFKGDIFAAQHGSWNRSVRTGYELIRVPLHQTAQASGEYEEFMTGFVVDAGHVWGRPVGVTVAPDGSLLVSDDGSNSVWRISYGAKP